MIIYEFLPNPVGKDTDGEWIKLFNDANAAVNLGGWQIKDASGKTLKADVVVTQNTAVIQDIGNLSGPLNKTNFNFTNLFVGFSLALALSFVFVFIFKKLDLLSDGTSL